MHRLASLLFAALTLQGSFLLAEGEADQPSGKVYSCKPGPWGDVKYYYIYLEAPAEYIKSFPMPSSVTRWTFPGATKADLKRLFTTAGLSAPFQDILLAPERVVAAGDALTVFPPLPDLEAMTPQQRLVVYTELSKYDVNEFHKTPVLITATSLDDWLGKTRLRPALVDVMRKLTYNRGGLLAFSDLSAVLNYVQSDTEAQDFYKVVTRTRSMIVRVDLGDNADIDALVSYWTGYNRFKDIAPILQSVAETEGVAHLGVIHLLPSMARRLLYSYPPMEMAIAGRMPDCHWTSLNFFNYKPKDYFLDTRLAAAHLMEAYAPVAAGTPLQYGDVLVFMAGETANAIHSCVYIADDIVFTKNGENAVSPWILMKLEEVKKIYFYGASGAIHGYRLKNAEK